MTLGFMDDFFSLRPFLVPIQKNRKNCAKILTDFFFANPIPQVDHSGKPLMYYILLRYFCDEKIRAGLSFHPHR